MIGEVTEDLSRWVPAAVLALVSVAAILRVVLRYDRVFVNDADLAISELRQEVAGLRRDLGACTRQHELAERQIRELTTEVAALRRQVEE